MTSSDEHYSDFHIDPPSPAGSFSLSSSPPPPPVIRVKNKHKERSAIVVSTKTKTRLPEEELPVDRLRNKDAHPDPPLRQDRPVIPENKEGT